MRAFSRVDTAKRHARHCPCRGSQALPTAKRGRRLRACDACSRARVSCDSKSSCGRCSSRNLTCTYKRLCDEPSHRPECERSTLPFLLKVTDPGLESITGILICGEPEGDPQELGTWSNTPPTTLATLPSDLFFGYTSAGGNAPLGMHDIDGDYDENIFGLMSPNLPNDSITARLDQLMADLRKMLCLKPKLQEQFDRLRCAEFFTTLNLQKYLKAFYCRRHYQLPLIHWPTFDPEKTSNQLLLAAMMTGASYSRHDENNLNEDYHMNTLYETAEKYIFKDLKSLFYSDCLDISSKEQVQLCQAGLLMLGLKYDVNSGATVKRISTKRLPILVKALRKMNIVGIKHESLSQASEWETFIHRETCIRLVMWTWSMDALDILIYNNPPLMTIAELSGHLPCTEALWDAPSNEEFDARRADTVLCSDFLCLKTLVAGLLGEDWTEGTESSYGELSIYHLHYLVLGE